MRTNLLLTSAIGLATALPTLAMANAPAATGPACGSHFFAQIDGKLLSAKLDVKEKKNFTGGEILDESQAAVIAAAIAEIQKNYAKGPDAVLFAYGDGASRSAFVNAVLAVLSIDDATGPNAKAAIIDAIVAAVNNVRIAGGLPALPPFGVNGPTSADIELMLTAQNLKFLDNNSLPPVPIAKDQLLESILTDVVNDIQYLAQLAKDASVPGATRLDQFIQAAAGAGLLIEKRDTAASAAAVINRVDASIIVNNALIQPKAFVVIADGDAPIPADFEDDLKTEAENRFNAPAFKQELENAVVFGAPFFQRAIAARQDLIKLNNAAVKAARANFDQTNDKRVIHSALAGGVGATAGYFHHFGNGFAGSISVGGDHHWGKFLRIDEDKDNKATDQRKLGFGINGDVGVHYVVSPSASIGVLVGVRAQQLRFGKVASATAVIPTTSTNNDSSSDYISCWTINPVVSGQARMFFTDNMYGALTVGYIIPVKKTFTKDNANVAKDSEIRFQGVTGGFSLGMTF